MPPPVGASQGPGALSGGGTGASAGNSDGPMTTGTGSSSGADSSGTGLGNVLLAGEIAEGNGSWSTPLSCLLRLYGPDDLDPGSGVATDFATTVAITIEAFPWQYTVTYDDVPSKIDAGWEGYIGVRCDFDGDGQLDTVGAYYPELPASLVTLPSAGIDMALSFL